MNKKTKNKLINFFILSSFILTPFASAEFNPEYIISDEEILNYDSLSFQQIDEFLNTKNGYLSSYKTTDPTGKRMTAAEIIYDRAQVNKISPKFLIVLLQKEQSLIEEKNPKSSQLDWATGYGCPDGGGCNNRWRGLWKQINSASLQFIDYMENPQDYSFRAGNTYTFTNPYSTINNEVNIVRIANQATAGLYNYTPHVYNGNYNFYNIWQRYFTRTYPNGTLLQAHGEPGVWLIQNGEKRPFLSKGALTTRFDPDKIIQINKSELDKYPKGKGIKFPQYSLLRSPMGKIYLLVDDKRRHILDEEAFRMIGFNPEEVLSASWSDISIYEEGEVITASSTYATGALLQDNTSGGVYYVTDNKKAPLIDSIFLKTKFKNRSIIPVSPKKLSKYTTVEPYKFGDGEIITSYIHPAVYIIADGKKQAVLSGDIFEKLGYRWENVLAVPQRIVDLYPDGVPLSDEYLSSVSEENTKNEDLESNSNLTEEELSEAEILEALEEQKI